MSSLLIAARASLATLVLTALCGTVATSARAPQPKPALRAWQPGPVETICDNAPHGPAPEEEGASDTRARCLGGDGQACAAWVARSQPLVKIDFDRARDTVRNLCHAARASEKRQPHDPATRRETTCSCGAYGSVLTYDRATEVDGLVLLDEACTRGWLDACDQVALIAELCAHERRPMCGDLALQGRLRKPSDDEYARPTSLPAELRGCWVEAGGTVLCFENDRISFRPSGGVWDQVAVSWRGYDGVGV